MKRNRSRAASLGHVPAQGHAETVTFDIWSADAELLRIVSCGRSWMVDGAGTHIEDELQRAVREYCVNCRM